MKLKRLYDEFLNTTNSGTEEYEAYAAMRDYLTIRVGRVIELIEAAQRSLDDCGVAGCTICDEMRAALKPFEDE